MTHAARLVTIREAAIGIWLAWSLGVRGFGFYFSFRLPAFLRRSVAMIFLWFKQVYGNQQLDIL